MSYTRYATTQPTWCQRTFPGTPKCKQNINIEYARIQCRVVVWLCPRPTPLYGCIPSARTLIWCIPWANSFIWCIPWDKTFIWMCTRGQLLDMGVYQLITPSYGCIPCSNSLIWMYTLCLLLDFDAWREPTRWFRWHWFGWYVYLIPRRHLIQMLVEYPAQLYRPLLSTPPSPENFPLCTPLQWLL